MSQPKTMSSAPANRARVIPEGPRASLPVPDNPTLRNTLANALEVLEDVESIVFQIRGSLRGEPANDDIKANKAPILAISDQASVLFCRLNVVSQELADIRDRLG
jgi:hypothetical protein